MSSYLPYLVIGVTTGSLYGFSAIGLVLTYKTSGIFNFGHGAIAAAAAVIFYQLHFEHGLAWPIAGVISVFGFGLIAGVVMERLGASLAEAPTAYRIVATVGLILVIPAATTLLYGSTPPTWPSFLPNGQAFQLSGVRVGWDAVVTFVVGAVGAAGLYLFFLKSRLGVSMRAVVDRPELVDLTGESPTKIRRIAWIIGCCFASLSGVLLANTQAQLDVILLSLLVVQAFGGAVFGAFRSLPLAYVGGLTLGVAQGLASRVVAGHHSLQGLDTNMPFLFLLVGLLVIPRSKLVELGERTKRRAREQLHLPTRLRIAIYGGSLALAVLVPFIVDTKLPVWNTALASLLMFLSLGLLVNTSGQISLCHFGFLAIGATTFAHMQARGLPWPVAVLIAGLTVVPVGAIISIPAIRLSGLYLALATLGFGVVLAQFFYPKGIMFGSSSSLVTSRPSWFQSDREYYFLLLAIGLVGIAAVIVIQRSRLGRLLRGIADSPTALSSLGTNTNISRVLVFCISAFMAGVSGSLIAGLFGAVGREQFQFLQSLVALSVLMVLGQRTIPAAILGCLALYVPQAYLHGNADVAQWTQLVFGLLAIGIAVLAGGRVSAALARSAAKNHGRLRGPAGERRDLARPEPAYASVGRS